MEGTESVAMGRVAAMVTVPLSSPSALPTEERMPWSASKVVMVQSRSLLPSGVMRRDFL